MGVSEPGMNTTVSAGTAGDHSQKHQKKNASSQCTTFPSSGVPTARMKRIKREQGELWNTVPASQNPPAQMPDIPNAAFLI